MKHASPVNHDNGQYGDSISHPLSTQHGSLPGNAWALSRLAQPPTMHLLPMMRIHATC